MRGIDVEELKKISFKIDSSSEILNKKYIVNDKISDNIECCLNGDGLEFLLSKLRMQLKQYRNLNTRIRQYTVIINQVIKSYVEQDNLTKIYFSNSISNLDGRG